MKAGDKVNVVEIDSNGMMFSLPAILVHIPEFTGDSWQVDVELKELSGTDLVTRYRRHTINPLSPRLHKIILATETE